MTCKPSTTVEDVKSWGKGAKTSPFIERLLPETTLLMTGNKPSLITFVGGKPTRFSIPSTAGQDSKSLQSLHSRASASAGRGNTSHDLKEEERSLLL